MYLTPRRGLNACIAHLCTGSKCQWYPSRELQQTERVVFAGERAAVRRAPRLFSSCMYARFHGKRRDGERGRASGARPEGAAASGLSCSYRRHTILAESTSRRLSRETGHGTRTEWDARSPSLCSQRACWLSSVSATHITCAMYGGTWTAPFASASPPPPMLPLGRSSLGALLLLCGRLTGN